MGRKSGTTDVKEKVGDYLLDVSKYIFTAVVLASFFEDMNTSVWIKYAVGILMIILMISFALFYFYKKK